MAPSHSYAARLTLTEEVRAHIVVDPDHRRRALIELRDKLGADQAGGACHENFHVRCPVPAVRRTLRPARRVNEMIANTSAPSGGRAASEHSGRPPDWYHRIAVA